MRRLNNSVALTATVLVAAATIVFAGACQQEAPPAATPPDVSITSPSDGSTVTPGDVTVTIQVENFDLVDKLGEEPVQGEGHVHFYKDVAPPTSPDEPAVTEEGTYAVSTETSHTWTDVEPGSHTFAVQLVNNDHTPLTPPVTEQVTVAVEVRYTEEQARQTAEQYVRNSPTFRFDGIEDSLELVETLYPDMEYAWQFVFRFESRHAGYGDRTGQALAQVITPHEATVAVERGEVVNAIMDEKWDMMAQEMLRDGEGEEVSVALSADNIAFDRNTITVPAGARVTMTFNNKEGVAHNFALYETSAADNAIFVGETITGPETITYEFAAPSTPGTYFFRCDVHPTTMTGDFIVE